MIIYKNESLLNVVEGIILHGCNCFNVMGAGVAKFLRDKYPIVYEVDCLTIPGDENKLGKYSVALVDEKLTIINCYTQYHYHYSENRCKVDYYAVRKCFEVIKENYPNKDLCMPKIGCGLAGGDWNIVESIINEVFDDRNIYVYYL
jgi:O-acetyl-ADP-ribose deacetylase (regulator of RNase III)